MGEQGCSMGCGGSDAHQEEEVIPDEHHVEETKAIPDEEPKKEEEEKKGDGPIPCAVFVGVNFKINMLIMDTSTVGDVVTAANAALEAEPLWVDNAILIKT